MMDFLRRLTPPRETDVTRAVAVLPSRFESRNPLRAAISQPEQAHRLHDDETTVSLGATSAPADGMVSRRQDITGVQPSQFDPRRKEPSSTRAPADAPKGDVAEPGVFQDRSCAHSEPSRPTRPGQQNFAGALVASHRRPGVSAPAAQPRPALPLSQAILSERTLQSRGDDQVVHVTIGRIEVVAATAPAPALRRSARPRPATLPLADYLRGRNGSPR
jgi:hypothetical protein